MPLGNSSEARSITRGVFELRLLTLEVVRAGVLCAVGRMEADMPSGMQMTQTLGYRRLGNFATDP